METIKLLNLGKGVYNYYRDKVKGNENISFAQAQRKLTRNIILAKPAKQKNPEKQLYTYGNLQMLVVGDCIVWIKNEPRKKGFNKDRDMYRYYTEILGIEEEYVNEAEGYAAHR